MRTLIFLLNMLRICNILAFKNAGDMLYRRIRYYNNCCLFIYRIKKSLSLAKRFNGCFLLIIYNDR